MPAGTLIAVKTVLVADDTAFVRDRFRSALESAGHRAITVRTGAELMATLRREAASIDLIVADLRLPDGRGMELLRAVRALCPERPKVVVFSGTIASADEVRELGTLGVVGYINEYTTAQHIMPSLSPHLFPDHYNRRSSPRVAIGLPVAYRVGNTIAAGLTLNLSKGGIAVRTTNPLEKDIALKVRFRLPVSKKDIEADARVAWSDPRHGMGLQFLRLHEAAKVEIGEFIDSHFFTNRKA
jgi:uncharacterized protein (TIGR02266 family)